MAGYCTLVLYFHSPAARENTAAHSCNIQPYYLLTYQIIYIYYSSISTTCPRNLQTKYSIFIFKMQRTQSLTALSQPFQYHSLRPHPSLMHSLHILPSEKWSVEFLGPLPKSRTKEIARSLANCNAL